MNSHKTMFDDPTLENALGRISMSASNENGVEMSVLPDPMVLAMSYVPMQIFRSMCDVDEGFTAGTVYPELNKPFLGGSCK